MDLALISLVTAPAFVLACIGGCISKSFANRSAARLRRGVTALAQLQCVLAVLVLVFWVAWRWFTDPVQPAIHVESFFGISILLDGVSCLMFAMVSYIGWMICRYSVRYLDGDAAQGNHYRWVAITLASVSLMTVAGNLPLFFVAWLGTSFGLHHLLLHFSERPRARRAAWTKFVIVRIGDVALGLAFLLIYLEFGTLQWSGLFAAVESVGQATLRAQVAVALLVLAAAIKSAQFPLHTWLPQTLETPTPVSALMHAGIVNAGGFLVIRSAPLAVLAPWVLGSLAIVGAITAVYGATVMLTQTSVKKSLAYSTIAQMGFMMLQCGLGAFSAAMLHIVAHSMYKAHAFLGSGSVLSEPRPATTPPARWISTAAAFAIGGVFVASAMALLGIDPVTKPGGLVLGAVLSLALARWVGSVIESKDRGLIMRSLVVAASLALVYATLYRGADWLVAASTPAWSAAPVQWWVVSVMVASGFVGMLVIEAAGRSRFASDRMRRWHVHFSNGLYIESTLHRVFGPLVST